MSKQQSFLTPEDKIREVLSNVEPEENNRTIAAISGGTDSVLAAWAALEYGPEYGLDPDVLVHAITGASLPQTRLVAQILSAVYDTPLIEGNNRTLAPRVLEHGWPAKTSEGHFYERIERKEDVFDKIHSTFPQEQYWISGTRRNESKQRKMNLPDSGIGEDTRRSRQTWVSPLVGILDGEKQDLITDIGLPVSQSYEWLGISGECVACAYDDAKILEDLKFIAPDLARAIEFLTVWLYNAAMAGETEISPKQLCWGWEPDTDDQDDPDQDRFEEPKEDFWIGCDDASCATREVPDWIEELPEWQIVDYRDVVDVANGDMSVIQRFEERL